MAQIRKSRSGWGGAFRGLRRWGQWGGGFPALQQCQSSLRQPYVITEEGLSADGVGGTLRGRLASPGPRGGWVGEREGLRPVVVVVAGWGR